MENMASAPNSHSDRTMTKAEELAFLNAVAEKSNLDSTIIDTTASYSSLENQAQVQEALRITFGERAKDIKITNGIFVNIAFLIDQVHLWRETRKGMSDEQIQERMKMDPEFSQVYQDTLLMRDGLMRAMIHYSLDEMEAVDKEITAAHPSESYDEVSVRINAVYDTFVAELIKRIPYEPIK